MSSEIFDALKLLEEERGINSEYLIEKIRNALTIAVRKDAGVPEESIEVVIDPDTEEFCVNILKEVVEDVVIPEAEVTVEEARKYDITASVGDHLSIPFDTKDFRRIAASNAKQVFRQGMKEVERSQLFAEMQTNLHQVVTAVVTRVDHKRGVLSLDIGKNEAMLPKNEQIEGEVYREGDHIRVYVQDVIVTEKGPKILLSRTDAGLVKAMFETEVPEIEQGIVEIKAISREAGGRTKIAVYSEDENVDPVGSCIGSKGGRVATIVEELHGEKIDIVKYNEEPEQFIAAALAPAQVVSVNIIEGDKRSCIVTVPADQLSLAIGNKGQNARLTAHLTGYSIDIKSDEE